MKVSLQIIIGILSAWLLVVFPVCAQQIVPVCGTTIETQADQLQKLEEYRRDASRSMLSNLPSTSYVPLAIHITSELDGTGRVSLERVFASVCKLNEDFGSINIQFYIKSLDYINNPFIYDHKNTSSDPNALYFMSLNVKPNAVNIFIGRSYTPSDEFLAYYTSGLDVIYCFKTGIGFNNPTLTHEMGHFFTLPHTFFGWEGTNYVNEEVNGKAPVQVGGQDVEKSIRNQIGENCQFAGDHFCDTPPDYSSSRSTCPFSQNWFDPDSTLLDPDEANFMSYFGDVCLDSFTQEQKNAIINDFNARGYQFLSTPSPLMASGAPTLVSPIQQNTQFYPNSIELKWLPVTNASRYYIRLTRYIAGSPLPNPVEFYTSSTSAWVTLNPNAEYRWTVEAMTTYDICRGLKSTEEVFFTRDWEVSVENQKSKSLKTRLLPNPVSASQSLVIEIEADQFTTAQITILDALGRTIMENHPIALSIGKDYHKLNINTLNSGIYFVRIETPQRQITHKLLVNK